MKTALIILSVLILLLMVGNAVFVIYLIRWMKRRDKAMAELLKRMLEKMHELESVRRSRSVWTAAQTEVES